MSDFDFEPVRGLPELPPEGERILWQGAPQWRSMAVRVFHTRKVAIYFAILILWQVASSTYDGNTVAATLVNVAVMLGVAGAALAILALLAFGYARSTVYTITSRRIVLRQGLALPLTVNIPFRVISAADILVMRDGTGDVAVTIGDGARIAWLALWPSTRPWHFADPQPSLKSIPDPRCVAELLADAVTASAQDPAMVARPAASADREDGEAASQSAPQAA